MTSTITPETRAWWHGCWWPHIGHHLHGGPTASREECPWHDRVDGRGAYIEESLDGGYAPRRMHDGRPLPPKADEARGDRLVYINMVPPDERAALAYASDEFPQGRFLFHRAYGCVLISWWDRTQGDTRGNCYSTFIVEGEHHVDDLLAWFPRFFPVQAGRLTEAGVSLVCVNRSPSVEVP